MKILIIGATGAFGSELAKAFQGNDLYLQGRDATKFPDLKAKTMTGDINMPAVRKNIINTCEDIDVFINSTALFQNCLIEDFSVNEISKIIETNLTSPIIIMKHVIEIFKKRGNGTIININSVAGKMGNKMEAVYCATKYGMKGFLDSVRYDCIQKGVKVIEIFPGAMSKGMAAYRKDSEIYTNPKELADFVTKLVDTKTFFPTGIEIHRATYE